MPLNSQFLINPIAKQNSTNLNSGCMIDITV